MSLSMYRASIPVFIRGLEVCSSLLEKGAAFADEKGLAHADVIAARLAPDMLPLAAQIQRASDTAKPRRSVFPASMRRSSRTTRTASRHCRNASLRRSLT